MTTPTKTSTRRYRLVAVLVLISVAYISYKVGHVQASRDGLRNLAFVSLVSVKPSVQAIEYANEHPGSLPTNIQVAAEGAVYLVARMSTIFDPNLNGMHPDSKSVLCAIAKNRNLYRDRSPSLYDESLMNHLARIHAEIASQLSQAEQLGAKARCSV